MNVMRQSWTDERLDDFRGEVAVRFDGVDRRLDRVESELGTLRAEMQREFAAVRAEMRSESEGLRAEMHRESAAIRAEMKAGFERMDERFERMHQLMLKLGGSLLCTMIAASAGVIATQL